MHSEILLRFALGGVRHDIYPISTALRGQKLARVLFVSTLRTGACTFQIYEEPINPIPFYTTST